MGRGILYSTCICKDGQMVPIESPYVLETNGKVREVKPSARWVTLRLYLSIPIWEERITSTSVCGMVNFRVVKLAKFPYTYRLVCLLEGMTEGCWYSIS